ncbi:pentatricopeptide repeat protein [Apiospora marii]|uniref:Pentatricopeptide repeat protein n=1 Tax=Apiospora marii TaxID=335849 RepID=A0ABR1SNY0_9PEZI
MKAPSNPICMLCRHALAARASRRSVAPWTSQAASYSTAAAGSAAPPPVGDGKVPSTTTPAPGAGNAENGPPDDERGFRPVLSSERPGKPSATVVQEARYLRKMQPKTDSDMNALFQQIVHESHDKTAASSEARHARSLDLELVSDIAHLEAMVDSDVPVSEAYHLLKTKIYPVIRQEGVNIPQIFFAVANKLMNKVIAAKKYDMRNMEAMSATNLPPVAEIFRVCMDVGKIDPAHWTVLVERLVKGLCGMSVSPADYPSIEAYENHLATRDEMLTDLVESWKVLSLPKLAISKHAGKENDIIDGFWFPRLEKSSAYRLAQSGNFVSAFSSLFPQYKFNKQLAPRVSVLAIATYALLLDRQRSNDNVRQEAAKFMAMVAFMIRTVRLLSSKLEEYLAKSTHISSATSGYIMKQWASIDESLDHGTTNGNMHVDPRNMGSRGGAAGLAQPSSPHQMDIEKRLSRAYGTGHLAEVDRVWHDFIGRPADFTPDRVAALQRQQDLFDSFINTYMALNDPDKAIIVWNTLPAVGLKPTLKTWNVMLDGCKKARNLHALNTIWSRLEALRVPLDIPIWTTRVAGLIDCGDPKAAIEALEELVKRWRMGQKEQQTDVLIPTMEPVNAAMAGLVRLNKFKAAQSLLSWSSRQGIRPDVVTFNILLRPLVREGREKEVRGLLDTMIKLGINADEATFTVILDGTLANVPLDDVKNQARIVKSVFQKMADAGLKSNLHTYGKMIYLLLRSGDHAQESVKLVLSELWAQGYELSPHIYTMLVEHYFARQPPDLDAVNKLLLRRRLLDYDDMDRVFYNRVIKGFAHVGELGTALGIYRKLHAAGFMVELDTQLDLLRALVHTGTAAGEHEARQLVEGTVARFKELHSDDWQSPQHSRFWGHAFWHFAVQAGVLGELPVVTDGMGADRY